MAAIITRMVISIFHLVSWMLRPILALIYFRKPSRIPSIKNPLLKLSATTLAAKIREGELSSQTVVEAYIERIKEVNPFINAVVEDRFEEAVNEAKICDAKLKNGEVTISRLQTEKPLYGVPVTIKESCSLKGMNLTGGTVSRRGIKATEDGGAVELLKSAGAIPLLVSNTSEYCTSLHSKNYLYGSTKNPYDRRKTPGGSSGGEAALIGAGASVLGLGSDFAGSIRIPALFTGICGHKPSAGIVPNKGHLPSTDTDLFQFLLTLGPMARHVDDLHLAMNILSSKSDKPIHLDEPVDLKNIKIVYMDTLHDSCTMNPVTDIRESIRKAARYLSERGAQVEQLSHDWLKELPMSTISIFVELEMLNLLDLDNPKKKNAVLEFAKSTVGLSQYTSSICFTQSIIDTDAFMSPSSVEHYRRIRQEISQKFNDILNDNTVLICPSFPYPTVFPQMMFFLLDCCFYSAFVNMLGLPATQVPMGLNRNGLPIGFQVISARYQDKNCLAVAKELEKGFGGWIPPS